MEHMHDSYIGFWISGVSDIQLAKRKESDFSRQVHFVELHEDFSAHFISLHNVVKQSDDRKVYIVKNTNQLKLPTCLKKKPNN